MRKISSAEPIITRQDISTATEATVISRLMPTFRMPSCVKYLIFLFLFISVTLCDGPYSPVWFCVPRAAAKEISPEACSSSGASAVP